MQKELENKFQALPTLKEVGVALMQFALKLQGTDHLEKDVLGMFQSTHEVNKRVPPGLAHRMLTRLVEHQHARVSPSKAI